MGVFPRMPPRTDDRAARMLADLIARELDLAVDDVALKAFIRANWNTVAACAHAIHDTDEAQ